MKINKSKLEKIINEEIKKLSEEDDISGPWGIKRLGAGGSRFPAKNPMRPPDVTPELRQKSIKNLYNYAIDGAFEEVKANAGAAEFVQALGGPEGLKKYKDILVQMAITDFIRHHDPEGSSTFQREEWPWDALSKMGIDSREEKWNRGELSNFLAALQWQFQSIRIKVPDIDASGMKSPW
tara:strand:- start:1384 stop:1923 length:540 start_codon:yes stop_codon:yes gene_type:complete